MGSAAAAGLRYVTDAMPGIRRQRHGRGFTYVGPDGEVIRTRESLDRFRSLVIPPAWTEVWICPHEDGHLQVTAAMLAAASSIATTRISASTATAPSSRGCSS